MEGAPEAEADGTAAALEPEAAGAPEAAPAAVAALAAADALGAGAVVFLAPPFWAIALNESASENRSANDAKILFLPNEAA